MTREQILRLITTCERMLSFTVLPAQIAFYENKLVELKSMLATLDQTKGA